MSNKVSLAECPVGLFQTESGNLCLKTEYGDNEGRIDAYIVATGEFFWGAAPQSVASQRAQLVTPVGIMAALSPSDPVITTLIERNTTLTQHLETLANWMEMNGDDGNEPFLFYKVISDARAACGIV